MDESLPDPDAFESASDPSEMEPDWIVTWVREHYRLLIAAALLVGLVSAVFHSIVGFEFIDYDISDHVLENPAIRGLGVDNLVRIFTTRSTTSYYPVRTLTYAVDYQLWGFFPGGYKLTNLLVHTINAILVFALALRLIARARGGERNGTWVEVGPAVFAAAVFAVHPLVVEPVTWVPGREELLMTLGALVSFHFYLSARRLEGEGRSRAAWACFAAAAVACAAGCLSNAAGAAIPLVLVAWDVLTLPRSRAREKSSPPAEGLADGACGPTPSPSHGEAGRAAWLGRILYGSGVPLAIGIATIVAKRAGAPPLPSTFVDRSFDQRVMMIFNLYWLNLKSLVWPTRLTLSYDWYLPTSFLDVEVLLGIVALGLTLLALWTVRRQKLLLFGLAWFGLALAPSAQVLPGHLPRADRYLYLPLVGIALVVAMVAFALASAVFRRRAASVALAGLGVGLVAVLAALSMQQLQLWQSNLVLWGHCVEVAPRNDLAHCFLADHLARSKRYDEALAHYKTSLQLNVDNFKSLSRLARLSATCEDPKIRDLALASRLLERAETVTEGREPEVFRTRAVVATGLAEDRARRGDIQGTLEQLEKAVEADAQYAPAALNLALLLATSTDPKTQDLKRALALAEGACESAPPDADQLMILAMVYAQNGRVEEAAGAIERAARAAEAAGNRAQADGLWRRLELFYQQNAPAGPRG